jgi:small subunit ribosomal protein S9
MADEPQNETSQDQPEDTSAEEPQAVDETPAEGSGDQPAGPVVEGSGDQPAGPVMEGSPPAHPPEGQPSTPPAGDASEEQPQDDAGEKEPAAAVAAEQEEPEAEPVVEEPEEPRAEKKKDVIPGADLEPIAVEPDERPLSAEEQARLEAEEEEKARREAALTGDSDEEEQAASRAPAKMESDSRYLATGKRKNAIARVTLLPGSGKIEINGRPIEEFFPRPLHQTTASQPLTITGYESSVDVRVRVHGGGVSGQAGAVRHGIARALIEVDPELRGELKRRGFLTRDARAKERRKAGLKKARKRPQFSKR